MVDGRRASVDDCPYGNLARARMSGSGPVTGRPESAFRRMPIRRSGAFVATADKDGM